MRRWSAAGILVEVSADEARTSFGAEVGTAYRKALRTLGRMRIPVN